MYYTCYWRSPREGTPENSDRIKLLDLRDLNNKHGDTRGDTRGGKLVLNCQKHPNLVETDGRNRGLIFKKPNLDTHTD